MAEIKELIRKGGLPREKKREKEIRRPLECSSDVLKPKRKLITVIALCSVLRVTPSALHLLIQVVYSLLGVARRRDSAGRRGRAVGMPRRVEAVGSSAKQENNTNYNSVKLSFTITVTFTCYEHVE